MVTDAAQTPALDWLAQHLQLIGWPALLGITWKFKGAFDKYFLSVDDVKAKATATAQTTEQIKRNLDVVQNNHLAHLAQDIKEVHVAYEKHTEILQSIDRNISVLVDRSSRKR